MPLSPPLVWLRRSMLLVWVFSLISAVATADRFLHVPAVIHCSSTVGGGGGGGGGGCSVYNYQGIWGDRQPCHASRAFYPTSEAELLHAVAFASKTASKVKVVSKGSHSLPKLVCPGGHDGILISTQFYNSLIHVNLSSLTVTAHAGVLLRPLLDIVAAHGLTLTHTPYWVGVSVAGMISTGAHGSGMLKHGSCPHDYVVAMRLVVPASEEEGYAKVVEFVQGDADLDAAKLSLGVLGAISTVTFRLEPMFKRSMKLDWRGDERLEDEVLEFARKHEFGKLKWFPGSRRAQFKVDDRVGVEEEGDGEYLMAFTDKMDVKRIEGLKIALETMGRNRDLDGLCEEEVKMMDYQLASGDGLVNHGSTFTGYPVVGFNHKVQAAGQCEEETYPTLNPTQIDCTSPTNDHYIQEYATMEGDNDHILKTCLWNPRVNGPLFFDTSIAIPFSRFGDAIAEIKKLRDLNEKAMCSLAYVGRGIHMRFISKSQAYLGAPTDSIVFEMVYYRSKTLTHTPWMHQHLLEEIEQMLLDKFEGRPHWGKNRELAFEGMHKRFPKLEQFLEVKQRMDPLGIFSSEWSDAILGLGPSSQRIQTFQDHCAIEGLCICQEDSHCHPAKGYFCRPGYVYEGARVCRYESLHANT